MISLRFAPLTAALLGLALIPTVIHSYRGLTIDDGLTVRSIPEVLAGMPSRPTGRSAAWVESNLDSTDWFERTYRVGAQEVRLFAARSFDAKRLYHHPELAVLRGLEPESAGRAVLPGRPDVPIQLLTTSREGQRGIAVYTLINEGSYIRNPILFQIRASAGLLVSGRTAMTLIMASDLTGSADRLDKAPSVILLRAAVQAFEEAAPDKDGAR
jgi:hypothetical protein